jgi:hypothetical protein
MITSVTNIVWENILTQEKSKKQLEARETVFRNNLFDELMRETSHRAMLAPSPPPQIVSERRQEVVILTISKKNLFTVFDRFREAIVILFRHVCFCTVYTSPTRPRS